MENKFSPTLGREGKKSSPTTIGVIIPYRRFTKNSASCEKKWNDKKMGNGMFRSVSISCEIQASVGCGKEIEV